MIISVDRLLVNTYNGHIPSNNTNRKANIMKTLNNVLTVVNLEHGSKAYFIVDNVHLLKVDNYLSCTSQYYIQDINA